LGQQVTLGGSLGTGGLVTGTASKSVGADRSNMALAQPSPRQQLDGGGRARTNSNSGAVLPLDFRTARNSAANAAMLAASAAAGGTASSSTAATAQGGSNRSPSKREGDPSFGSSGGAALTAFKAPSTSANPSAALQRSLVGASVSQLSMLDFALYQRVAPYFARHRLSTRSVPVMALETGLKEADILRLVTSLPYLQVVTRTL
jgi:hypothetical protein